MSELFTDADRARVKKNAALIIFAAVFAIVAILVMVNVSATEDTATDEEPKTSTEQIIDRLNQ